MKWTRQQLHDFWLQRIGAEDAESHWAGGHRGQPCTRGNLVYDAAYVRRWNELTFWEEEE